MCRTTDDLVIDLRTGFEHAADADRAQAMAAYLKDKFVFFGVPTPERRQLQKPVLAALRDAEEAELLDFAECCWRQPEREFHQVGVDALRKWQAALTPASLPRLRRLIITNAWWDTVDGLAAWTVGPLVARNPELSRVMDEWIDEEDLWLARTAILHQLSYKEQTDPSRLFDYACRRSGDREFFIRKALGWALRQYARTDPDAVREFVAAHPELSGLTRREALKHL